MKKIKNYYNQVYGLEAKLFKNEDGNYEFIIPITEINDRLTIKSFISNNEDELYSKVADYIKSTPLEINHFHLERDSYRYTNVDFKARIATIVHIQDVAMLSAIRDLYKDCESLELAEKYSFVDNIINAIKLKNQL